MIMERKDNSLRLRLQIWILIVGKRIILKGGMRRRIEKQSLFWTITRKFKNYKKQLRRFKRKYR
jgi:hypothetical protein